jgi:FixJ family two-component response regulator
MPAKPVIYVVDDDIAVCGVIADLLASVSLSSQCFHNAVEFLATVAPSCHGCILLDVRIPDMSGMDLQKHLNDMGIDLPVIFLTGCADVPTAVQAIRLGAFDLLEKPFNNEGLLERVQLAVQRDRQRWARRQRESVVRERLGILSPRERQVLDLVVDGHMTKQIASMLRLSHKTVENHRTRIMHKMQADGVVDLVRQVLQVRYAAESSASPDCGQPALGLASSVA